MRDAPITSAAGMAAAILAVLAPLLHDAPWAVLGHSVGALVGYELIQHAAEAGFPAPELFVPAAFIAPDVGA